MTVITFNNAKFDLNKLTWDDLVILARHLPFYIPERQIEEYSDDDVHMIGVYRTLNDPLLYRLCMDSMKKVTPLKLFAKNNLRWYIETCYNEMKKNSS